jgi:GT2 family glycosyltransferase
MDYGYGISIVIPNYNGRHLLEENLPFLFDSLKIAKLQFEIIVADDCSTDDSIEYLKLHYPSVHIISTSKNSGFSTTCNTGIAVARYRYTCIVNSDVTFNDDYFLNSIRYLDNPKLFAVKGDIVNYRESYDDIFDINRDIVVYFKRGHILFKNADKFESKKYDYKTVLLGCCFICRTEMLKDFGGFDEIFSPYYREDLDLAMTAIKSGYAVQYIPDCQVYHKIGSTISNTQPPIKKQLVAKRNKFLLTWKHLDTAPRWTVHILFIFLSFVSRWIVIDWKWYVAFVSALIRYSRFKPNPDKSELKIEG